ncbi:hypothetical protein QTV49_001671 [Vibrio vulnificus]|nr:hypothetical protein [Vibrio vulnificus]
MKPIILITPLLLATFLTGCSTPYSKTASYDGFNEDEESMIELHTGTKKPVAYDICGSTEYLLISNGKKKVIDDTEYDVFHCISQKTLEHDSKNNSGDHSIDLLQSEMDELF